MLANGGNFKTLFLNGQLHLRSSLGKPLIAPVTLPSGADVQFNGSNAADRLRWIGRGLASRAASRSTAMAATISLTPTPSGLFVCG